jgi:hypothetical protein
MTEPTCKTCKWWIAPSPPPLGWGGHINEYGTCRHFANDRLAYTPGLAGKIRFANETRAEHTCGEHTPKDEAND